MSHLRPLSSNPELIQCLEREELKEEGATHTPAGIRRLPLSIKSAVDAWAYDREAADLEGAATAAVRRTERDRNDMLLKEGYGWEEGRKGPRKLVLTGSAPSAQAEATAKSLVFRYPGRQAHSDI